MRKVYERICACDLSTDRPKEEVLNDLISIANDGGYQVAEIITDKPWGAMVRFETASADNFIENFFPDLDPHEARLGRGDMELSPKFLLVAPDSRLSWQYHKRRAERWAYVTDGAYFRSDNPDDPKEMIKAALGEVVQVAVGECHRLVGGSGTSYTLVAEIWQHTDPSRPSDEDDIIRVQDDYQR